MKAKVKAKKTGARKASAGSAGKVATRKAATVKTQVFSKEVSGSKVKKMVTKTLKNKAISEPLQRAGRTTTTRLSAKNQITIPVEILRKAGFKVGDTINCTVDEEGKVLLTHPENPMLQFAGIATGVYDNFDLRAERDSWDE